MVTSLIPCSVRLRKEIKYSFVPEPQNKKAIYPKNLNLIHAEKCFELLSVLCLYLLTTNLGHEMCCNSFGTKGVASIYSKTRTCRRV